MSGFLESVQWNACVHRLDLGLYSHPRDFTGEWSQNPVLTPRGKPLYWKLRGGLNQRGCIMQDSEPNTLQTELFHPKVL